MISVPQALQSVKDNLKHSSRTITKSPKDALGFVLAESILSPINMPPFSQSAMDGYAINGTDLDQFTLIGEIQAGESKRVELKRGEAFRIFTGAPVPESADAVVMQELVERNGNDITIVSEIKQNQNIRPLGEQITQDELALEKGTQINAAIVGFLSGLGVTQIEVFDLPKISIIATGNELIQPGNALSYGEIYESNAIMLESVCIENGFNSIKIHQVKDDYQSTKDIIEKALEESDFLLITGGISVGDYDFVGKALLELGVSQHFYKVKQKPGKPLFFGTFESTNVFALPGNPAAALTGFYMYILNALNRFSKKKDQVVPKKGSLTENFFKKGNRAQFLKAYCNQNNELQILKGQSSAMLRAFSMANAFVYIPEEKIEIKSGEMVTYYSIPHV